MKNRKIVSNKRLGELDSSTTNIKKIANHAGVFNPTGGILASRKFGGGLNNKKSNVYQMGSKNNKLLMENDDDTFDDNLSQGDVFVVGG